MNSPRAAKTDAPSAPGAYAPRLARTIETVRENIAAARARGLKIGLVPTMGALHEGHASLIQRARAETGYVVVSIFVNPTQFGPREDLSRYPRPLDQDLAICGTERVDLVFAPEVATVYPPGFQTIVEVEQLQKVLCGPSRPGHFRGVTTVVLKLFNVVQPDIAYFGQKDGQQARIIQQMVRDLNIAVEIRVCPIVREPDGLALSSRNQYLDPQQRRQAIVLHRALETGKQMIEGGERDASALLERLRDLILSAPAAEIDYIAVVDADSLQPVRELGGTVLLALAVRFGETRLIDNVIVLIPPR
jgi:pantoate--beta-alanine ligase